MDAEEGVVGVSDGLGGVGAFWKAEVLFAVGAVGVGEGEEGGDFGEAEVGVGSGNDDASQDGLVVGGGGGGGGGAHSGGDARDSGGKGAGWIKVCYWEKKRGNESGWFWLCLDFNKSRCEYVEVYVELRRRSVGPRGTFIDDGSSI